MTDLPSSSELIPSETINSLILKHLQQEDISIAKNLKLEVIMVTADKAKLSLTEFKEAIEAMYSIGFPAGTFLAVVTTLVTADFHNILDMSGDTWQAFYLFVAVGCLAWMVKTGYVAFQKRQMRDTKTVLEHLKGNT